MTGPSAPVTAILTTDKCHIRPYENNPAEAEALTAAANHPEVSRWMRNRYPYPYTLKDATSWLATANEAKPLVKFAIVKPDGTFVGGIGLEPRWDVEYRTCELGYWIAREAWGQGIVTSAVAAFLPWAFATFPNLLRVEAVIMEPNAASARVLEKLGFVKEGTMRAAYCKNDVVMDKVVYGLLRQDWEGRDAV